MRLLPYVNAFIRVKTKISVIAQNQRKSHGYNAVAIGYLAIDAFAVQNNTAANTAAVTAYYRQIAEVAYGYGTDAQMGKNTFDSS